MLIGTDAMLRKILFQFRTTLASDAENSRTASQGYPNLMKDLHVTR